MTTTHTRFTPAHPYWICPSILSANFVKLGEEVQAVMDAGADRLHIDVMDQHYVPNLTFGPLVCESLVKAGFGIPMDVHLMVMPVDPLIAAFAKAGARCIVFHPEASLHVDRSLQLIRDLGCQAGLAINPGTPLYGLEPVIDKIDRILLMSVNPGFGGQSFISSTLNKARTLRDWLDTLDPEIRDRVRVEIDGGVKVENIAEIAAAGVDAFVAGSAIFGAPSYAQVIAEMRAQLNRSPKR